jgi:hypothetical protein
MNWVGSDSLEYFGEKQWWDGRSGVDLEPAELWLIPNKTR